MILIACLEYFQNIYEKRADKVGNYHFVVIKVIKKSIMSIGVWEGNYV